MTLLKVNWLRMRNRDTTRWELSPSNPTIKTNKENGTLWLAFYIWDKFIETWLYHGVTSLARLHTIGNTMTDKLSLKSLFLQTIREMESLVDHKINLASHEVTLKASHLMSSETLNLQSVFQDEQVRLYLWGNLSKNPRYMKLKLMCHNNYWVRLQDTSFTIELKYCSFSIFV